MLGLPSTDVLRNASPFLEKEPREARNRSSDMLHPTEEIMSAHCLGYLRTLTSLLLVAIPFQAPGQSNSDFSNLTKHIHQEVTVLTPTGKLKGQLSRVEESSLVVDQNGSQNSIRRDSIKNVSRRRSRHTVAWVGGMAAGFLGLGLLAGFSRDDDAVNAGPKIAGIAAGMAGVGAAIGFALSRIGKDPVIYESSPKAVTHGLLDEMVHGQIIFHETQPRYLYRSCNSPSALCGYADTRSISEEDLSVTFSANAGDERPSAGVEANEKPAGENRSLESQSYRVHRIALVLVFTLNAARSAS